MDQKTDLKYLKNGPYYAWKITIVESLYLKGKVLKMGMVVEDDIQLQKILEVRGELPYLRAIVQYS